MRQTLTLRLIYLIVFVALSWPLIKKYSLPPAEMEQANKIYKLLDSFVLGENGIAFVALDFGPSTIAENKPQAESLIEHLMRRHIHFALITQYALASPFLESIPQQVAQRLMRELPSERWEYGKDWVNLGFQPGGSLFLQSLAKAEDLTAFFKKDAKGTPLSEISAFHGVKTLKDVKLLGEFTGLTGMFSSYVQFFKTEDHTPVFIHGCTSITIPDAYIYLDSGQLMGLFEGIAGAAWYSVLHTRAHPSREQGDSLLVNTALGVAHLVLLALIVAGNVIYFYGQMKNKREAVSA